MIGTYPNVRRILDDEFFQDVQVNSVEGMLNECYRLLWEVTLSKKEWNDNDRSNAMALRTQIECFGPSDGDLYFDIRSEYDGCDPGKAKKYDPHKCELFVLINLVMVDFWLEDQDCDMNQVWYHLLRARAAVQILIDGRIAQKKGWLIKFPEDKAEGAGREVPENRPELILLKDLIVRKKPDGGWSSRKELAKVCEDEMMKCFELNKLEFKYHCFEINIGRWIREYSDLNYLFSVNIRAPRNSR